MNATGNEPRTLMVRCAEIHVNKLITSLGGDGC
jgi:hypothetical protein